MSASLSRRVPLCSVSTITSTMGRQALLGEKSKEEATPSVALAVELGVDGVGDELFVDLLDPLTISSICLI